MLTKRPLSGQSGETYPEKLFKYPLKRWLEKRTVGKENSSGIGWM
jgi:hypothetical protein